MSAHMSMQITILISRLGYTPIELCLQHNLVARKFAAALRLDPTRRDVLFGRAIALSFLGDTDEARHACGVVEWIRQMLLSSPCDIVPSNAPSNVRLKGLSDVLYILPKVPFHTPSNTRLTIPSNHWTEHAIEHSIECSIECSIDCSVQLLSAPASVSSLALVFARSFRCIFGMFAGLCDCSCS